MICFINSHLINSAFYFRARNKYVANLFLFDIFFQIREIFITPSNTWGGQGALGISIRFCSFEGANENVWHIMEVEGNSPAEQAGLRSFTDYVRAHHMFSRILYLRKKNHKILFSNALSFYRSHNVLFRSKCFEPFQKFDCIQCHQKLLCQHKKQF